MTEHQKTVLEMARNTENVFGDYLWAFRMLAIKDTPETRKLASDRITLIADELLKVRAFIDAKMEESCDSDIS